MIQIGNIFVKTYLAGERKRNQIARVFFGRGATGIYPRFV